MKKLTSILFTSALFLSGCSGASIGAESATGGNTTQEQDADSTTKPVEATSFLGTPLYQQAIDSELDENLKAQIQELEKSTTLSEDDYIALGGLQASRRHYQDAIKAYSKGLEEFPESYKLRRHRGHRYMTVRELELAIVDFTESVGLIEQSDVREHEYDAKGKAHGTYEHWVWYHIGLYYYLHGDYETAAGAFERCVDTAETGDMLIGVSDWLYNIYRRMGQDEKAELLLSRIPVDIEVDTTYPYYKRVMLYKGEFTPDDILDNNKPIEEWNGRDMTVAYGLGNWYAYQGKSDKADALHKAVIKTPFWSTWAYLAAEKEQSQK